MKKILIIDVIETEYEDNTCWVTYKYGNKFGYEIVQNNEGEDNEVLKEKYQSLYNSNNEVHKHLTTKKNINECSEELMHLLEECESSENSMYFVDKNDVKDKTKKEQEEYLFKLKEEIERLGLKEYVKINNDDYDLITVYGGAITQFLFGEKNDIEVTFEEDVEFTNSVASYYGNSYYSIGVKKFKDWNSYSITRKDRKENWYLPSISVVEKNDKLMDFEIQTTSYGAMAIEEIEELIKAYKIAVETVKEFKEMFID